jgi:hypothetical protein
MADGSAQKNIFCIHKGNRNQKLLARRMSFAISHQELARCGSTSARYLPFVCFAETRAAR